MFSTNPLLLALAALMGVLAALSTGVVRTPLRGHAVHESHPYLAEHDGRSHGSRTTTASPVTPRSWRRC
ncbi:hypothetical protein [Deinococcus maricopensis]|uniref:hypothetical protein n=1 Tax=Deinococcus maricopensis TaxID=309887 RepID=UPI0002DC3015|nr:hypothetical protein [Deinococcus maricopensis]